MPTEPIEFRSSRNWQESPFARSTTMTGSACSSRNSQAGYRLYCSGDLEKLEQIVALKFLGIPLKEIRTLLDRDGLELVDALRIQRRVLEEKRSLLESAIRAIQDAEQAIRPGQQQLRAGRAGAVRRVAGANVSFAPDFSAVSGARRNGQVINANSRKIFANLGQGT